MSSRVRPPEAAERARALDDVRALARPRLHGSRGAADVDRVLRERFLSLGYELEERAFHFSDWSARYGPATGGAVMALSTAGAGLLLWLGRPAAGALCAALGLASTTLLVWLGPRAVDRLPWGRRTGSNWLLRRPHATPRYLVVAHRDSKSQSIPTLLRTAAVALALCAALILLLDAAAAPVLAPGLRRAVAVATGLAGTVAGLTMAFCFVGNASPGALDNATGLAVLLGVARRVATLEDVGFLVTDAEELGLAGSRAEARKLGTAAGLPQLAGLINLDGIDDAGPFRILERVGRPGRRRTEAALPAALEATCAHLGYPLRRGPTPLGVMLDHTPFAAAGVPALTVVCGGMKTLLRVHRPADDAARLNGEGVARAVAIVDGALLALRAGSQTFVPTRPPA